MKKIYIFLLILMGIHSFAETVIGTIDGDVEVLRVGVLNGNIPVSVTYEEKKGLISTTKKCCLTVGKEKLGYFDDIETLTVSPDGKTLVYVSKTNDIYYINIGDEKYGPFSSVGVPIYSPDGETLVYEVETDSAGYLYVNNRKYGPFVYVNNIAFSPDGKTLAYSTNENDGYYVYAYGNRYGPFHVVSLLTFLPDGTLLYKTHDKHGGCYIHRGNKKEGPFRDDDIDALTYSPDGKIYAYTTGTMSKTYLCVGDS